MGEMKKDDCRIGDLVRVTGVSSGVPHEYEVGTVLPILHIFDDGSGVDLGEWACRFDEIELVDRAAISKASPSEGGEGRSLSSASGQEGGDDGASNFR